MAEETTTSTITVAAEAPRVVNPSVAEGRALFMKATRPPTFDLVVVKGAEVAIVMPSEGVRGQIQQQSVEVDGRGRVSMGNVARRKALTVIAMVHSVIVEPGTGQKRPGAPFFSDADLAWLMGETAGADSVLGMFSPKCEALQARVERDEEVAAKNA